MDVKADGRQTEGSSATHPFSPALSRERDRIVLKREK